MSVAGRISWCEGVVPKLIAIRCPKSNPTQPMDPARPLSVKRTELCQMNNAHVATKQEVPHNPLRYKNFSETKPNIDLRFGWIWDGLGLELLSLITFLLFWWGHWYWSGNWASGKYSHRRDSVDWKYWPIKFRHIMRGWQRERVRHVRKRLSSIHLRGKWNQGSFFLQENQRQILEHKTKALVQGKKSLHQLQVKQAIARKIASGA